MLREVKEECGWEDVAEEVEITEEEEVDFKVCPRRNPLALHVLQRFTSSRTYTTCWMGCCRTR
jgi:hypothetical protein